MDAACAAASQGVDVPCFILTGELRIDPTTVAANAHREFDGAVANAGINQYSHTLSSVYISGETTVEQFGDDLDASRHFIGYAHRQFSGRSTRDARFPIILYIIHYFYLG